MKAGWAVKALGEVCTLQRGFDLPTTQRTAGIYPLVTSSGPNDTHDKYKVEGPGVVTGRSGSIGHVYYVEDNFWPLNTALYVKDFHGNDPKFVWYLLQYFDLSRFSTGAGVPTLNRNDVHGEAVHAPSSTDEQKRIVEVLDGAFEGLSRARTHTEINLQNARELFESGLESIVATAAARWPNVALSTLTASISDGDHAAPPKAADGVPFITISNVNKETLEIDFSDTFKVPQDYYDALKDNRKPKQGDVLYSVTGSFGIPVHVEENTAFCFQRHIGLVRPQPALDSRWLFFLLLSPHVYRQADEGASGTAQRTVSLTQLRSFSVPDVPLAEQIKFAAALDAQLSKSRELQSHYRAKLADLDALRQALLQKAFAGELT